MTMPATQETTTELKEVTIYTDGGAVPNPGRGGYGVVLRFGKHAKELSGGYAPEPAATPLLTTTNDQAKSTASKTKMTEVGQPCRKCATPVVKKVPKKKTVKSGQTYYYDWYLFCPGCKSMYMVEDAKREVSNEGRRLTGEETNE